MMGCRTRSYAGFLHGSYPKDILALCHGKKRNLLASRPDSFIKTAGVYPLFVHSKKKGSLCFLAISPQGGMTTIH